MAGILKHWRESASLIIASKKLSMPFPKPTFFNKLMSKKPELLNNTNEDFFRVLLLKRRASNKFMPESFVFPGGMIDANDFSDEWLDVIGCTQQVINHFSNGGKGPPIFSRARNTNLPSEIGLRITAIRETFEESGVLLARPVSDIRHMADICSPVNHPICSTSCNISPERNIVWRNRVIADPSQFLPMCKELEIVPDIWSLYEWSNWLTPVMKGSRFDTAFFICCVEEAPLVYDSNETEEGVWLSPSGVLKACVEQIVSLAPPQLYELSRLIHFTNIYDLLSLSWKHSSYRSEQWMPVIFQCQDSLLFVLPGDDMYPSDLDHTGESSFSPIILMESLQELQTLYPNHNRIVIHKNKQLSLYCNLSNVPGYVMPAEFNTDASKTT
ncbi:Nucleoside diphosphate-linked moiety X motif 19, mitochondrial [Bulinus truncatus]|nr:Nucleoside diphosphate-linked moiety X motif 19, mitochondrial [Bulinus truncatus]